MLPSDLARMNQRYPQTSSNSDEAFADQINANLPTIRALAALIKQDRSADPTSAGIYWWKDSSLTVDQATLISDYLVRSVESIETNLVEARLHLLEAQHAFKVEEEFMSRSIDYDEDGDLLFTMRPRNSGADDLGRKLRDLHIAGFFRAVGSALDCLAAGIVGVLAIAEPVNTVGFANLKYRLLHQRLKPPLDRLWGPTVQAIHTADSGPTGGWLSWTLGYRNALVHRARPMNIMSLEPRPTLRRPDRDGYFIATKPVLMLSREPSASDIMALRSNEEPVLTEEARDTIEGVFEHTHALLSTVGSTLVDSWILRRSEPDLALQPPAQWPTTSSKQESFRGFRPGSAPYEPALIHTSSDVIDRMSTAQLLDHQRTADNDMTERPSI